MNLSEIARVLKISSQAEIPISGVSIDSRTTKPGELYIAIRGERFDGHRFMADAVQRGAVAVVCESVSSDVNVPSLVVPSTLQALAEIATVYRQSFICPAIAVTGSNGKTTVKEMIARILPKPALSTQGNLNNHIGVPLSVLCLEKEHRYAVFELGANHPGEIAHIVSIVQPQVALINNIGPAHIEGFGSIDGVARAKGEIYQGLSPHGVMVINDDDKYAHFWDDLIQERSVIRFSSVRQTDVYASDVVLLDNGCAEFQLVLPTGQDIVQLKVPGMHHVNNALAAAACCYAVGISLPEIVMGLESFDGVAGRITMYTGKNNATIIDDTYNANLRSTLAAVNVLAQRRGKRILVLGDMAELGDYSERHHEEVGLTAREQGIDALMTYGTLSAKSSAAFGEGAHHYDSQQVLIQELLAQLDENTSVLVKGSRSAGMENIIQQLI